MARSYRELLVWQKAKALAVEIYKATDQFPRSETYGLTSQIRRAAVSVASNIAEGQGRLTSGEFLHFLGQARGSLLELDTQLAIALDLNYLEAEKHKVLGPRCLPGSGPIEPPNRILTQGSNPAGFETLKL
jgi:four helix bundle protein